MSKNNLSSKQSEELLKTLEARFENNKNCHKGIEWSKVQTKLENNEVILWSLNEMGVELLTEE